MTLSLSLSLVYLVGFFTWVGLQARKTDLGPLLLPIVSFLGTSLYCIAVLFISAMSALMAHQYDEPLSALFFANVGFIFTCLLIELMAEKGSWISWGARVGYWIGSGLMVFYWLMVQGYI